MKIYVPVACNCTCEAGTNVLHIVHVVQIYVSMLHNVYKFLAVIFNFISNGTLLYQHGKHQLTTVSLAQLTLPNAMYLTLVIWHGMVVQATTVHVKYASRHFSFYYRISLRYQCYIYIEQPSCEKGYM